MELTSCPECGAPAEVTWRFCEEGTDGPVEHVKIRCVERHWFMGAASTLLARVRVSSGREGS
jgi:hypothetical protein